MSVPVFQEQDSEELDLPGRHLRWIVHSNYASMCIIRVAPGETVRPAHSHPNGDEIIHIMTGSGRVMVEGEVSAVRAGSTVLFEQGKVHMLQNNGTEEMKVACFFAPPTNLENYKMYPDVEFPE